MRMMRCLTAHLLCAAVWAATAPLPAGGQQAATPNAPPAAGTPAAGAAASPPPSESPGSIPIPRQILTARRVFISNAGVQCAWFVGPDRAYRGFYRAMRQWGKYQLSSTPNAATLNFEISFACPAVGSDVTNGNSTGPQFLPRLKLVIRDIHTRIVLWSLIEPVRNALLQSNRDKNFNRAMGRLMARLERLDQQLPAAERRPVYRPRKDLGGIILLAATVAAGIILTLVAIHHMHQMQSQFPQPTQPPFP